MTPRRTFFAALVIVVGVAVGWLLFVGLPRWYGRPAVATAPPAPSTPAADDVRKIKVRLFYVGADGTRLISAEHEVPFADQPSAQARHIIEAQLAPAQPPLVSAIPVGTTLRALFVTTDGTAVVDLSPDVATAHPGGSINELLTVYTLVQALTFNLPAIGAVQVLVDGHEVDTLAGHVDIKRALPRDDSWVSEVGSAEALAPQGQQVPGAATVTPPPATVPPTSAAPAAVGPAR